MLMDSDASPPLFCRNSPTHTCPLPPPPQVHLLKKDLITAHQKGQEAQQELDNQRSHFQQQIKELLDEIQDLQFQVGPGAATRPCCRPVCAACIPVLLRAA